MIPVTSYDVAVSTNDVPVTSYDVAVSTNDVPVTTNEVLEDFNIKANCDRFIVKNKLTGKIYIKLSVFYLYNRYSPNSFPFAPIHFSTK